MDLHSTPVVLTAAAVATMAGSGDPRDVVTAREGADYGLIRGAAVVVEGTRVAWVGPADLVPDRYRGARSEPLGDRLITPGLVECSTHLLFAGDRRGDFAARAAGQRREDPGPGGIGVTAAATAAATDEELLQAGLNRAWWFIRQGVTTLEVKTGYGLTPESELRLLRIAGRLRDALPIRVQLTLLAGHTYPADVDPDDYIMDICDNLLPAAIAQGNVDYVEVYCEETAGISMEHASTILETVYRRKVPTRVSADHLSDSAGGALAPAFYSKVASHLNFTDDIAVKAMGRAGTTAVLLPASALEAGAAEQRPPIDLLRDSLVPLAISTGFNPGTAPLADLRTAAHLGCILFGLTLPEAIRGITSVAAHALALDDGAGTIVAGGPADFAIWDVDHPEELVYWVGAPTCYQAWSAGKPVHRDGGVR
ncbi:imidazolonepropionase [soil metagenome]